MGMNLQEEMSGARVEFWFDPVCPWTWITSRWLTEVESSLGFTVVWNPFSLAILTESTRKGGSPSDSHRFGQELGAVLVSVREAEGNAAVARVYAELGALIHHEGRTDEGVLTEALQRAHVVGSRRDDAPELLRVSTREGIEAVGPGVGIPIVAINGRAFFGPVISPRPRGEEAIRLWHAVYLATQTSGLYELKRGRTVGPQFDGM